MGKNQVNKFLIALAALSMFITPAMAERHGHNYWHGKNHNYWHGNEHHNNNNFYNNPYFWGGVAGGIIGGAIIRDQYYRQPYCHQVIEQVYDPNYGYVNRQYVVCN